MSTGGLIMLCADDYGLAEGVSQGIHELAEAQLISATSAIVKSRNTVRIAEKSFYPFSPRGRRLG